MNIEEMMSSLKIDGKNYFEAYAEAEANVKRARNERKEATDLSNLLALHCFPLTGQVIAKHQLLRWRRPTDLAKDFADVARIIRRLHTYPQRDPFRDYPVPKRGDLINSIRYREGMTPREYERLALSVGSTLRRIFPSRLEIMGNSEELRSKLQPADRLLAKKIKLAYELIFYEGE